MEAATADATTTRMRTTTRAGVARPRRPMGGRNLTVSPATANPPGAWGRSASPRAAIARGARLRSTRRAAATFRASGSSAARSGGRSATEARARGASRLASRPDTRDVGAAARQLRLERLEAAVEMVDPVDRSLPLSGETRDGERHGGAQVRRHHGRPLQVLDALHIGRVAVEPDASSEAG